jgi:hypothetical protein
MSDKETCCLCCLWCGQPFPQRTTGGSAQRFCCPSHRHAFGTAARRWAVMVVEAGLITVEILKVGPAAQRAGREVSYQQLG